MLPLVAAIALGLLIAGCANRGQASIPVYSDPTTPITVKTGNEFVIQLDYNPTEGYFWYEGYDDSKLELNESTCVFCRVGQEEFLSSQSYALIGPVLDPAAQYSRFIALSPGQTQITMSYKNSPSAEAVEAKVFAINIE